MARKFLTALDLAKNELQNAAVQSLPSAPASPVKGQMYFDTSNNTLYWCEVGGGTPTWVSARGGGTGFPGFGAVTTQTTFGQSPNNGVGTTTARNDHTHGTPTHLASDHTSIPLSTLATPTADVNMGTFRLLGLPSPGAATDAATKGYVDGLVQGLAWKDAARAATTGAITLSGTQVLDGVTLVVNDRVLVKNQIPSSVNGIYTVASGTWPRATDADSDTDLLNACVFIAEGTNNGDTAWVNTTNMPINVDVTGIVWAQFGAGASYSVGAGLGLSGNVFDVNVGEGIIITSDAVTAKLPTAGGSSGQDGSSNFVARWDHHHDLRYPKKYTNGVPTSSATSQVVNHALNTREVIVEVRRALSPYDTVECDVERTDANNVTLRWAVAPAANEYQVIVIG